ncbi:MAG: alginate O-acetyltransferase complex protein AlgI [Gaiellaceae bacterium]|nr:alginate O-acetyltransferase complex protein AlgI [Gaiellaceae bacterium]
MLFNSYAFLCVFLPAVVAGFFLLPRQGLRVVFLVLASYVFYAYAQWWFPALMIGSTAISFTTGLLLARDRNRQRRKLVLATGIAGALALLAYFKYAQFAAGELSSFVSVITGRGLPSIEAFTAGIVLPVGISFFTFEAISYMVDVYRGDVEVERNPLRYAFFISFFPHLIAGPIVRYGKLGPQLRRFYRFDPELMLSGLVLFSLGLAKKVVLADQIAARTDALLGQPGQLGLATSWAAMIGYAFQIYLDFSGYTDMALGLARMFGIELPWNFDRPYRAASPREFWRRWHVTLSTWLRDYLYIPLGGNRKGPQRRDANLLATMGLGGLWHGASLSFAVWGLWHGLLLVVQHHLERLPIRLPRPFAVAVTFVLVTVGWVFFRMRSPGPIADVLSAMAGANGIGATPARLLLVLIGVAAVLMWCVPEEWRWNLVRFGFWRLVPIGLATALAILLLNDTHRFIYFQF